MEADFDAELEASLREEEGTKMLTTENLLDLIETEGSLEYLFLEHGLNIEELEDDYLAGLIEEILPTLKEIHLYLEGKFKARDNNEVDG